MATPSFENKLATAKTILTTAASVAGAVMLARSLFQDFLPNDIQHYYFFRFLKIFSSRPSHLTIVIDELDGLARNQIYEAANIYLGTKLSPSASRLKLSKPEKEHNIKLTMESHEEVVDMFNGFKLKWVLIRKEVEAWRLNNSRDMTTGTRSEARAFELTFRKKDKDVVFDSYLPYIEREAEAILQGTKTLKIFTVDHKNLYGNWADVWVSMNLDHPATFDTIAMDPVEKDNMLKDLQRFVERKDYYRKVGKVWKRGYLLHGPPGTGKSSLIAAMANFLNFDVYDLELSTLRCNAELRTLLLSTGNRSIIVVEDIDCTIHLQNRSQIGGVGAELTGYGDDYLQQRQVTLSGFLNFIDGLWSSCGDARVIVFTTNQPEKLDAALLRPGRMDLHVNMTYIKPYGFKVLAGNYLGIQDHVLFGEINELIGTTQVTPAEVAEQLMRHDDHDIVLNGLIEFIKLKKKETCHQPKLKLIQQGSSAGVEDGNIKHQV